MVLSALLLPLGFILLSVSSCEKNEIDSHAEIVHAFVSNILSGMNFLDPEQQLQTIDVSCMHFLSTKEVAKRTTATDG